MSMFRHHFETMGTVASLAFAAGPPGDGVLDAVHESFEAVERRFSLYRHDSEISRVARGELALPQASGPFLDAYAAAIDWRIATRGAFEPHRPADAAGPGVLDLSGIVKATAIQTAAEIVRDSGVTDALISIGGDGVALGRLGIDEPWTAGIVDPDDHTRLLCSVRLDGSLPAIATSGTSERGEHVWRRGPVEFGQVTVLAGDIVTADVLATAILSAGRAMRDEATDRWDIDVLTVDDQGVLEVTPGLRRRITASALPRLRS